MSAPAAGLTAVPYPLVYRHLGRGRLDLLTADLRLMLCTSAYLPADTDEYLPAVVGYETAGAGYVAGGAVLVGQAFDYDLTARRAVLTCEPVTFAAGSFIALHGVVYAASAAGPGSSPLISRIDFGASLDPQGADVTLTFAGGVLRIGPPA